MGPLPSPLRGPITIGMATASDLHPERSTSGARFTGRHRRDRGKAQGYMVPAMHAPALWFLYIAPPPSSPETVTAIVRALERGREFFTQHLIQIWADVGDASTGRALADLLSAVDDARFHDSLSGNVAASMDIIEIVTTLSKGLTT
jgi:hypothetical protein